jgi:formylglycine-generating enzyme required for sulfatase activity
MGEPLPDFDGGEMKGHYSRSYVNLMPYVRRNGPEGDYHLLTPLEFHVETSELYQRLAKGHHGVQLTTEEWDRFVTWIDLNVPFWGTWTEETGGRNARVQKNLARRKEMAEKWAGDKYDPEKIVNPYVPGTEKFEAPVRTQAKPSRPVQVAGWPFDASRAKEMQGGRNPRTFEIGGGESIECAYIPAGSFAMGSDELTPAERPVGKVAIRKGFWMATREITQGQFRLMDPKFDNGVYDMHYKDQVKRGYYMGSQDPDFAQPGNEKFPAIRVSWNMARQYCEWLSKKLGKKVRLPTEAEWEWACRAGTDTEFNYGTKDSDFSSHENMADYMFIELAVIGVNPRPFAYGNDPKPRRLPPTIWDYELRDRRFNDRVLHLAKVGSYAPNAWGLYDMHGNVAEWTANSWHSYPYEEKDADGDLKVVRGGSWYRRPVVSSSAWRWRYPAWMRPFDVGFRVVVED